MKYLMRLQNKPNENNLATDLGFNCHWCDLNKTKYPQHDVGSYVLTTIKNKCQHKLIQVKIRVAVH